MFAWLRNYESQGEREAYEVQYMVDDISIPNAYIKIGQLYKVQHLRLKIEDEPKEESQFDVFFSNVGVEILEKGTEITGEIWCKEETFIVNHFKDLGKYTQRKIASMIEYLDLCIKEEERKINEVFVEKKIEYKVLKKLKDVKSNLEQLKDQDQLMIIGGYKGLVHSMLFETVDDQIKSAIFTDKEGNLPFGIVQVSLL